MWHLVAERLLDFVQADFRTGADDQESLHQVAEFADIAWPVIIA